MILSVADLNSAGLREEAAKAGVTEVECLDSWGHQDARMTAYQVTPSVIVVTTNGDPIRLSVENENDAPMPWYLTDGEDIIGAGFTRDEAIADAFATMRGWR